MSFGNFATFEILCFLINSKDPVLCVLIYRPPNLNCGFITEFSELLSLITQRFDNIILLGDFNIHICCPSHPLAAEFISLCESFDLVQSVNDITHNKGHILDLVPSLGRAPGNLEHIDVCVSDHKAVVFNAPLPCPSPISPVPFRSRVFNSASASTFCKAFSASLHPPDQYCSVDDMTDDFNSKCLSILDSIAPFKTRIPKQNPQPWLNEYTRSIKRECRRAERKWKTNNSTTALTCLKQLMTLMTLYQQAVKNAKVSYFANIITNNSSNPRTLFKVINSVISPPPAPPIDPSPEKCEEFLKFFLDKVRNIRLQITPSTRTVSVSLTISVSPNNFEPTTQLVTKINSFMKPSSCSLDIIPVSFLKGYDGPLHSN